VPLWESYHLPTTVESALDYLARYAGAARVVAGGTDLLLEMQQGRKPPVRGEVSTIIGYPFKEGQIVRLTIDDQSYEMFSKGDTAWVDTGSDKKIVAAMKAGKSLKVEGTSWRGTQTVDTYSLIGISAALAAIDQACN